jgi:hypothetical protein
MERRAAGRVRTEQIDDQQRRMAAKPERDAL